MRSVLLVIALLAACAVASVSYRREFELFKKAHNKAYPTPAVEDYRFDVFTQNMLVAEGLKAMNPYAYFGVNKFFDLTPAEFKKTHHNAGPFFAKRAAEEKSKPYRALGLGAIGPSVDWRAKGAVTGVKDQGSCGGCWSFSSTGNIEGQWAIAGHGLVSLSEQELISCDTLDSGCNGGLEYNSWKWLISTRGGNIFTEASYPYKSGGGSTPACNLNGKTVGAKITDYENLQPTEAAIANFMYTGGPVSVGVDATSWLSYTSGIITNCISRGMDHSVLAVGYNDTHVPSYWVIKNSWGTSWGEQGYVRIAKGSNQCLVADDPSTSVV